MRRAAAACALVAVLLVWPVLGDPMGRVLGHEDADTFNHLWGFAHVASGGGLWTDAVGWPEGGSLWFIDTFNAAWTAPLTWLGGPALAMNVALFANLVFAGVAMFGLARAAGASSGGAALAAVAYQAQPQLLAQLHNGITETVNAGWLPLAIWAFLVFRRSPTRRTGLLAGLALAACGLANFYYGLFAGLAALGFLATLRGHRGRAVARQLPWAALGALPLLGALYLFRVTLNAPDALVLRQEEFVWASLVGHNMVDVLSFFVPGVGPDLLALFDEQLVVRTYIGWSLLAPALYGVSRVRAARGWGAAAFVAFVFALGPFLYYAGDYALLPSGERVALPFLAFFKGLPLFSAISHAYRFAVPLQLCLAVCAGLAVGRWGHALAGLFLIESLAVSPRPVAASVEAPAVYASIGDEGAVLDLPVTVQVLARSRYDAWQIEHGRPIPYGFNDPTPASLDSNRLTRFLIEVERSSVDSLPPQPTLDLVLGLRALRADGYAAIVVHRSLYVDGKERLIEQQLSALLGEGEVIDDAVLYRL